jgi:hypothetical protein
MDKTINTKASTTPVTTKSDSQTLTVVVLDENSQPAKNAKVSITPSDASGVTNNSGEIQFTLTGTATKYDITAKADGKTVTVPYYVTQGGATRLVVNPVYVQSIEAQLHPFWRSSGFITGVSVGLGILIILVIVWKLFKRRKR